MRVSRTPGYVPISEEESLHAVEVIKSQYHKDISEFALQTCSDSVGEAVYHGMDFDRALANTLANELPVLEIPKRALYEEAIRVIFIRSDSFAARHAQAHGHDLPKPIFKPVKPAPGRRAGVTH